MGGRITIAAALFLWMCGEADPPTVTVEAEPSASIEANVAVPPSSADATHGGTILTAGPHRIEIVVGDEGVINAYAVEGSPPLADAQITVRLPADDDEIHPVVLIWDPSHANHRGRLRQVQPLPGPIEIVVTTPAGTHRGNAPRFVVIAAAEHPVAAAVAAPPSSPDVVVMADRAPSPRAGGGGDHAPRVVATAPPRVRHAQPHIAVTRPPHPHRPHVTIRPPHPRPGRVVIGHRVRHGHDRGHRPRGRRHRRGHGRRHDDDDDD